MRDAIAVGLLQAGLLGMAMLFGANLYEVVVSVPNWRDADLLKAYRAFAVRRNPGHYYRVLSPLTNVVLLASLLAGWGAFPGRNAWVGAALGCMVAAELFTVAYFFPRNRSLFEGNPDQAEVTRTVGQWSRANYLRMLITVSGFLLGMHALRLTGIG